MTAPKAGGTPVNLFTDPIDTDLAIDGTRVYFATENGDIKSVSETSGAVCTIATGQSTSPNAIAVDDKFVCWTPFSYPKGTASVWRASTDCCLSVDGGTDASADAAPDGSSSDAAVDDAGSG